MVQNKRKKKEARLTKINKTSLQKSSGPITAIESSGEIEERIRLIKRTTRESTYDRLNKRTTGTVGRREVQGGTKNCSSEIRAKSEHTSAEQCFTTKQR